MDTLIFYDDISYMCNSTLYTVNEYSYSGYLSIHQLVLDRYAKQNP